MKGRERQRERGIDEPSVIVLKGMKRVNQLTECHVTGDVCCSLGYHSTKRERDDESARRTHSFVRSTVDWRDD